VSLLGEKMPNLTQNEMDDLKDVLPEADKNLFLQFREGLITLD
jgi:hypothetical protein